MRLIILFLGIALAAGAFVLTSQWMAKPKGDQPVPIVQPQVVVKDSPTVDIYTAKKDISLGTVLTPEMLDIQPFPKNLLLDDMVQADPNSGSNLVKMVARTSFQKGEPLFMNKLGNEKDPGFLAASLPKGMRMVTIAVDTISGVGNFVYPGDRVDVLITHDVKLEKSPTDAGAGGPVSAAEQNKKSPVTEVLLANVKVLAVNQKAIVRTNDQQQSNMSNVSLEVSATEAQKIRLTENGNGRLSLALRSLKDREENELARPTGVSDLSRLTPPTYFSVLYDGVGKAEKSDKPNTDEVIGRSLVNIVRGTKTETIEVTQP